MKVTGGAGALLLAMLGCWTLAGAEQPKGALVVGMELKYPPFEMADEQGNPTGVSVDLARALGQFLGKPVEIQNIAFDGLIPSLKSGKIDLILSSMTATPERAKSIAFSDPYLKTGLCLLVRKNSAVQSIRDLDATGRTVAVKNGTTGQLYAASHMTSAEVLVLDDEAACVLEVIQGKADGFIYDQMSIYQHWKRNPDTTRAILKPFQQESWAIGLRQADVALRDKVNAFIKDFRAKGGFDALGDKYLKEQKEAFRKMGIPFYF